MHRRSFLTTLGGTAFLGQKFFTRAATTVRYLGVLLVAPSLSANAQNKRAAKSAAAGLPAWLAGVPLLHWTRIPNTSMKNISSSPDYNKLTNAGLAPQSTWGNPADGIFAYSGGTIKGGDTMLVFGGGGAGGWAGNEIRALKLTEDAPLWRIPAGPSPTANYTSQVWPRGSGAVHAYLQDGISPNARHSYWGPQFIDSHGPYANSFFQFLCRNVWESDSSPPPPDRNVVDSCDFNTYKWRAPGTHPNLPVAISTDGPWMCKHPTSERIYIGVATNVWMWDPLTNAWTQICTGLPNGTEYGMAAVDTHNNVILRIGLAETTALNAHKIDLNTTPATPTVCTLSGPGTASLVVEEGYKVAGGGLVYDRGLQCFWLFQGNGLLKITPNGPNDWRVDYPVTTGTAPPKDTTFGSNLLAGRMQYVPALNGICIILPSQDVYFLRTASTGSAASLPPQSGTDKDNYQGLWWATGGTESGWGINFAHQGSQIFATWYTYDTAGNAWWLSMLANELVDNSFSGSLYAASGHPFDAAPFAPVTQSSQVGTGTLTFADEDTGIFTYTIDATPPQTKAISRFDLGTGVQPTCTYEAATPDFAAATNYQDLWWVANGAEAGWGINFAHQGNSVFATWYTYDSSGTPMWLSVLAARVGTTNAYEGTLYRSSGPRFDAYDAAKLDPAQVGKATLNFIDGNTADFHYTVNGTDGLPLVTQTKRVTRFRFAATGGTLCQ